MTIPDCSDPSDDGDATPLDILPINFHHHAREAVGSLSRTVATNERRALAGHPPVPCQLTGKQAEALAAMVMGLTTLLNLRDLRKGGEQG